MAPEVLVDRIEQWAHERPDHVAFRFLREGTADGAQDTVTYAKLVARARAIAAELTARGLSGQTVLLLYPSGLEFAAAFVGCLYAGVIAVPAYPPDPARLARTLPRLQSIATDSRASAVLTSEEIAGMARALSSFAPDLARLSFIATDPLRDGDWRRPDELGPDRVAFLQYTSGSTATPRGVVVTHGNIMHNQRVLGDAFGTGEHSISVCWLPLFHDMGLIGHVLSPLYLGTSAILMAPQDFLRRPVEWLRAIDRFRATVSGAPDFGYALCARKATDADIAALDLSCWRVAYSGAEPVRARTMEAFADRMAPARFNPAARTPCYGLAESTLMATSIEHGRGLKILAVDPRALANGRLEISPDETSNASSAGRRTHEVVSVGAPFQGTEMRVVDTDTGELVADGQVGEIWLRGGSVARGYWENPEESARVFGARTPNGEGPFLRTGDLGAMHEGELYVTGRAKDLIIVRGRNLYPEDLEQAIEACNANIRPGCAVAFAVEVSGEEHVVVACEVVDGAASEIVAEAVRAVVAAVAEVSLHAVVLLARHALPKTSSGKRQRRATRQGFLDGTLEEIARVVFPSDSAADEQTDDAPVPTTRAEMEVWLSQQVAAVLGCPVGRITRDASFESMGLDSVRAVELAHNLDVRLGRPLHPTILYNVPTVAQLAGWLVQGGPTVADGGARSEPLYPDLPPALERLDRRNPETYRFDLDNDIPWKRIDEPGLHVTPELFATFGIDAAPIAAEPAAWNILQTASGMSTCAAFEIVEVTITLFIDTRWGALGATRSLELFREEEHKHVRLFRRYGDALRGLHPDLVVELGWDPAWGVGFWELLRRPQLFPSEAVFHYLFWFFFVAFEEHSIYLADELAKGTGVQPAWLEVHRAHRREEIQHVATDYAYARALALSPAERDAWSEVCVAWLCQHFDTFFAFGPARRLVAQRFPHLAPHLRTPGFVRSQFLRDLLNAPSFKRTRMVCPYLRDLEQMDPAQWPTDADLADRLPSEWRMGRTALAPSAVEPT